MVLWREGKGQHTFCDRIGCLSSMRRVALVTSVSVYSRPVASAKAARLNSFMLTNCWGLTIGEEGTRADELALIAAPWGMSLQRSESTVEMIDGDRRKVGGGVFSASEQRSSKKIRDVGREKNEDQPGGRNKRCSFLTKASRIYMRLTRANLAEIVAAFGADSIPRWSSEDRLPRCNVSRTEVHPSCRWLPDPRSTLFHTWHSCSLRIDKVDEGAPRQRSKHSARRTQVARFLLHRC